MKNMALAGARVLRALLPLFFAISLPKLAVATSYSWKTAVDGSIFDSSKWNPVGVPGGGDQMQFGVTGTYTVSFHQFVPSTSMITCTAGNVSFDALSPHNIIGGLNVMFPFGSNSFTLTRGTLSVMYVQLGQSVGSSTMNLTNLLGTPTVFHSGGRNNPNSAEPGDTIGFDGSGSLNITGGAQYFVDNIGTGSVMLVGAVGGTGTIDISGSGGNPQTFSALRLTNGAIMKAGHDGAGVITAHDGGFIDATGDFYMAYKAGSFGFVTVGPGASYLDAHQKLIIGGNNLGANSAGHGELTVADQGWVRSSGACEVGDPDNDTGSILRVRQGGTFTAMNGLKVWPTTAVAPLSLAGGLAHVRSGAFVWPAGKYLYISSQSGTPTLLIDNGITNVAPNTNAGIAQLHLARNGSGTLRLVGAGTVFPMGPGSTVVGDSLPGNGTIDEDSLAVLSGGPMNIGVRGRGHWNILGGSLGDVGTVAVGVVSSGNGSVQVIGAGSKLRVRDNLWVGGGFGGAGGTGSVLVDDGATLEMLHVTGINPSLVTIYANGNVALVDNGLLTSTGTVSVSGYLTLRNGRVEALNVSVPTTGTVAGRGQMSTMLQNAGRVDPNTTGQTLSPIGAMLVTGTFTQFSAGHYIVDLDSGGTPPCDILQVSGNAQLAGALDLRTQPGFVPNPGQTFTILTCGSRTGTFSTVTWNGLPLSGQASIVYEATRVTVVIPGVSGVEDSRSSNGQPEALRFAPAGTLRHPAFALELPEESTVQVKLFDVRGREVATLFEGVLSPASRRFEIEAAGRNLTSGTYFARAVIESGRGTMVRTARAVFVR